MSHPFTVLLYPVEFAVSVAVTVSLMAASHVALQEHGGSIINISATLDYRGAPLQVWLLHQQMIVGIRFEDGRGRGDIDM